MIETYTNHQQSKHFSSFDQCVVHTAAQRGRCLQGHGFWEMSSTAPRKLSRAWRFISGSRETLGFWGWGLDRDLSKVSHFLGLEVVVGQGLILILAKGLF